MACIVGRAKSAQSFSIEVYYGRDARRILFQGHFICVYHLSQKDYVNYHYVT